MTPGYFYGTQAAEAGAEVLTKVRCYGKTNPQVGSTDWCDVITNNTFTVISGNNTWGSDEQLVGTADTPAISGNTYYRMVYIYPKGCSQATLFRFRVVWGTGTAADAVTAGQFTECDYIASAATPGTAKNALNIDMPRVATGTKVWIRARNETNASEFYFTIGLQEFTST